MIMIRKRGYIMRVFNILFIVTVIAMSAATAHAGISVTPDRHIVKLSPGETSVVEYKIINTGAEDMEIELDPKPWGITKDIKDWLALPEMMLVAKPGREESFEISLTAPKDAKGEFVGMVFLCYKENKHSILNTRNGFPVYLIIEGTESYDISVLDAGVSYTSTDDRNAIDISLEVKNTGNIHIVPDVITSLIDSKGKVIREFFLEDSKILLRDDIHTYNHTWLNPILPDGDYQVISEISDENLDGNLEHQILFKVKEGKLLIGAGVKE